MIVLGADAHKRSYTIAAVHAMTGQVLGDKPAAVGGRGFGVLLVWKNASSGSIRCSVRSSCRLASA